MLDQSHLLGELHVALRVSVPEEWKNRVVGEAAVRHRVEALSSGGATPGSRRRVRLVS